MKSKLSPETIEKLEWLKGRLRKYPHRYDQSQICGTQACLFGFCAPKLLGFDTITLSKRMYDATAPTFGVLTGVAGWLQIDISAARRLFSSLWGKQAKKFNRASTDTDEQAAEKACQRIDLFIESGGTQ